MGDNQLFSENKSSLGDLFLKIRIHGLIDSVILIILLKSIILLFKIVRLILSSQVSKFSLLACQLILIPISHVVSDPFPYIDIWPWIYRINVFHIIWKVHSNNFISMNLQANSNITIYWKEVVQINNIVLACCKEESTIRWKSNCCYVRGVTIFVLFNKDKGLECTI